MQGSLGAGVLPYKESGNRRRDLVGGGEGTLGLQLGLPSATMSVPTTFLLLEEMYLGEDIIWTRK